MRQNLISEVNSDDEDNSVLEDEDEDDSEDSSEDDEAGEDVDDEEMLEFTTNMKDEPGSDSGCTAVVAIMKEKKLWVANAGDSRCVVCRKGKCDKIYKNEEQQSKEIKESTFC